MKLSDSKHKLTCFVIMTLFPFYKNMLQFSGWSCSYKNGALLAKFQPGVLNPFVLICGCLPYLQLREKCLFFWRWVAWSFRGETDLVFCFLSCLVKFPAHEANSWRRRASSNPGNWVFVFLSFLLLFLPTVLAFFHDQTHILTQTRKVRRQTERPKGDREQFASLDLWITD